MHQSLQYLQKRVPDCLEKDVAERCMLTLQRLQMKTFFVSCKFKVRPKSIDSLESCRLSSQMAPENPKPLL